MPRTGDCHGVVATTLSPVELAAFVYGSGNRETTESVREPLSPLLPTDEQLATAFSSSHPDHPFEAFGLSIMDPGANAAAYVTALGETGAIDLPDGVKLEGSSHVDALGGDVITVHLTAADQSGPILCVPYVDLADIVPHYNTRSGPELARELAGWTLEQVRRLLPSALRLWGS